ncbi:MAG: DUF1186 domain-containing protein [Maioricimonas sp. JB049]
MNSDEQEVAGEGTTGGVPRMTPDEIRVQLASAADGDLIGAIMACREQRETMTPLLLKWLRERLDEIREKGDEFVADGLSLHALYVLAEFDAREALPIVVEALRMPGNVAFDFFGDAVDTLVARLLAAWDTQEFQHIGELLRDRSLDFEERMSVADAFPFCVRDGRMTRQEAIERVREFLRECLSHDDSEGITAAVFVLCRLGPNAANEEIEEAFRKNQVEAVEYARETWHEAKVFSESAFDEEIADMPTSRVDDAAEELADLYGLNGDLADDYDYDYDYDYAPAGSGAVDWLDQASQPFQAEIPAAPPVTIRNETPKVGRNDPCPCGSGKKFKKCCGKSG